jgi:hypothetical protein
MPFMRRRLLSLAALTLYGSALCATCAVAQDAKPAADPKASFREKGRVGVIGALTEDMWKGGAVFEHEHFEVQLLAHFARFLHDSRDVHSMARVGGRVALGTLNYFAAGAEFATHAGSREHGVDTGGAYEVGPYVSLQRYFAATPVMLNLWVNPILYGRSYDLDGPDGSKAKSEVWRFFQSGGFGLAYLFF